MDQPLLDQRFYQPSDGTKIQEIMETFYHYEKLLTCNWFCLCEVTPVAIATISYLPAEKRS